MGVFVGGGAGVLVSAGSGVFVAEVPVGEALGVRVGVRVGVAVTAGISNSTFQRSPFVVQIAGSGPTARAARPLIVK